MKIIKIFKKRNFKISYGFIADYVKLKNKISQAIKNNKELKNIFALFAIKKMFIAKLV